MFGLPLILVLVKLILHNNMFHFTCHMFPMICCESFIRWLLGTSRHKGIVEHKTNVLASPLPASAKRSNKFDYNR